MQSVRPKIGRGYFQPTDALESSSSSSPHILAPLWIMQSQGNNPMVPLDTDSPWRILHPHSMLKLAGIFPPRRNSYRKHDPELGMHHEWTVFRQTDSVLRLPLFALLPMKRMRRHLCFLCFKSTFVCVMLPEHGPEPISSATLCPISDLVLYFVRSIPEYALSSYLNASTK